MNMTFDNMSSQPNSDGGGSGTNSSSSSYNCTPYAAIRQFRQLYFPIHIYLSLTLCPVGVVTNVMNVIILNQRVMRSPTNFMLTILAITDGLIMALYIPFVLYFLKGDYLRQSPYSWAVYMMVYVLVQNILHVLSTGIIVALATFRVIYIRFPFHSNAWCNINRVYICIVLILLTSLLLTIPYAVAHKVVPACAAGDNAADQTSLLSCQNSSVLLYRINYVNSALIRTILFWVTAIFVKLLPVIVVTILSVIIIAAIQNRSKKVQKLKGVGVELDVSKSYSDTNIKNQSPLLDRKNNKYAPSSGDKDSARTTRLLLVIVLIFMMAYLPQATLLILGGILGVCFTDEVYDQLGDILDLLTLTNSGINFVLYCVMSRQFRNIFIQMFCSSRLWVFICSRCTAG